MKIWTPDYYHRFRCIAADCPDSCCKEWEVDVDEKSAAYYRAIPGTLGDTLRRVLRDTEDGTVMTIQDGRCPMWREDGLCRIQAAFGHEALCDVCRTFPRLRHDYGDFAELGLELSCPEAARLIFAAPNQTLSAREIPGGEAPEYDTEAMEVLLRSRQTALEFLRKGSDCLSHTLAILLLFGYSVQNELDGGEEASLNPERNLEEAFLYAQSSGENAEMESIFDFFKEMEILTPQWEARLNAGAVNTGWNEALRSLLEYGILRYWLQAVSDYDLICRVKFLVIACLLVNAMGGSPVETAQLFSKEIENDPDNLEAILDGAYTHPALTDQSLFKLLLKRDS